MRSEREVERKTLIIGSHFKKCFKHSTLSVHVDSEAAAGIIFLPRFTCLSHRLFHNCIGKRSLPLLKAIDRLVG